MQRQPSSSTLLRHPSSSHASGMHRQPSASGMHRNGSVSAPLRQGSSPAMQRRSEQSPNPYRGSASPAMQRPGTASSGGGMSQRQSSMTMAGGILKPGSLAALLRQASSPGVQRPEGLTAVMHRQRGRHGSSPAVQRPEAAAAMYRQGGRDSVPRQSRSPELQRPESSSAAMQRQGSRTGASRGISPALQHPGAFNPPVLAADFAGRESSGLTLLPSGNLEGRGERVSPYPVKLNF